MPVWLIVIIAIFAFIALLLSLKINIVVSYKEDLSVYARILFIKIKIYPGKEKQHSEKHKKKNDDDRPIEEEKTGKKSQIKVLFEMRTALLNLIDKTFGYLHFRFIRLNVIVSEDNAAKTALAYGGVTQGISYLLEILNNISNVEIPKKSDIAVKTDFINNQPHFDGKIVLYIRTINAFKLLFFLLKNFIKFKEKTYKTEDNNNGTKQAE